MSTEAPARLREQIELLARRLHGARVQASAIAGESAGPEAAAAEWEK